MPRSSYTCPQAVALAIITALFLRIPLGDNHFDHQKIQLSHDPLCHECT
ncbi:hypothetical protein XNC3_2620011 [Xenorhabdus nematophila F1]|nr:hypothetical protein XNC3_2620011 [Xenorhabdus nematophila F1]CEE92081.1 hypothetical protein XNA1_2640012 [Xenorhabdus nematophila str. Anatoliense]CEK25170.1 protein of unknown function [Xenorhabdus nematophila AN6/1]